MKPTLHRLALPILSVLGLLIGSSAYASPASGPNDTTYVKTVSTSICNGDSIFLQQNWQKLSGVYVDSLTASNGADSLIITKLSLYPKYDLTVDMSICAGDSAFLEGGWRKSAGLFTDRYPSVYGCDSTVHTNLHINYINNSTSENGLVLHAAQGGMSYQWINCETGDPIPGATWQNFTVFANGSYAVQVSHDGCTVTSNCLEVAMSGLEQPKWMGDVKVVPNPSTGKFTLNLPINQNKYKVAVINSIGQSIKTYKIAGGQTMFDLSGQAPGFYLIQITNKGQTGHVAAMIR